MFIRQLRHANGHTYVQVIEKLNNKYIVKRSFGAAVDTGDLSILVAQAKAWIEDQKKLLHFDFSDEKVWFEKAAASISSHKLVGIHLLLNKIFDTVGFAAIKDSLFKDLVFYRLAFPKSKLKTTEYLHRYEGKQISEDVIYRYMDKLQSSQMEQIQQISYTHTLKILNNELRVVFYDVTTIYFEADEEDELRKTGFSKEGKHQNPQIVLGLLVSKGGYPLAYEIFEGNKFEGHTMLPLLDEFKKKFNLQQLVIVADSGLLSKDNISNLIARQYAFIIGARIKNEAQPVKERILQLTLNDAESAIIETDGLKLIISYSAQRAKKDKYNREKGIRKLEKQIYSGRLTKTSLNNKGYNKFLQLDGEVTIRLNQQKILADQRWDGLKGYITNAQLDKETILENYAHLWQIEKAFRIAKTDLKIRPIYHYRKRRIEAHICLNFAAYKIYKELERQLHVHHIGMSAEKAIDIAKSIYQIEMIIPASKEKIKHLILLTDEQKKLALFFDFGC